MRFRPHSFAVLFIVFTTVATGLLAFPRAANAAATMDIAGGTATYTAGPYIVNVLTVTFDGTGNTFTFQETGETISLGGGATGAGCTGSGTNTVVCPGAAITAFTVNLQDYDDTFTLVGTTTVPATVNGGSGNDTITTNGGVDTLNGDAGNDTLTGARGNDTMAGGAGNDTLIWNNGDGSDIMDGDADTDTVQVNGSTTAGDNFTIAPNGSRVRFDRVNLGLFNLDILAESLEINGGDGDEIITGTTGLAALITMTYNGGLGNDTFIGGDGVDTLNGDEGNDTITGARGNDIMKGGEGDDTLIWNNGDGSDIMDGDGGNDTVQVNGSTTAGDNFTIAPNGSRVRFDRVNLGLFNLDILAEALEINGGDGDEIITGTVGLAPLITMTYNGGLGNDTFIGGDGVDTLNGDEGNDSITGAKGNDIMSGGEGDDTLIWNNGDGSDIMDGDGGNDTVQVNGSTTAGDNFTVNPNGSRVRFDRVNLGLFNLDILAEALEVNGGDGDEIITGTVGLAPLITMTFNGGLGNDTLVGGDGVDNLNGDEGNDTITGAKGNDIMKGGEGDDTLIWNNGDGSDTMDGDGGADTVQVNGSTTAGDNFTIAPNGSRVRFDRVNLGLFNLDILAEALEINGGDGDEIITGTVGLAPLITMTYNGGLGNDTFIGGDGADTLNGDEGNDSITGAKGNDIMKGGEGDDTLIWNNGDGSDIMDGDGGADTVQVNGSTTAGDNFEISQNGARVRFERVNLGLFSLDILAEALEVNGFAGDELISVSPLDATVVTLDGGDHDVGDTLTVNPQGAETTNQGGVITIAGHADVNHLNFETVTIEEGTYRTFMPLVRSAPAY